MKNILREVFAFILCILATISTYAAALPLIKMAYAPIVMGTTWGGAQMLLITGLLLALSYVIYKTSVRWLHFCQKTVVYGILLIVASIYSATAYFGFPSFQELAELTPEVPETFYDMTRNSYAAVACIFFAFGLTLLFTWIRSRQHIPNS